MTLHPVRRLTFFCAAIAGMTVFSLPAVASIQSAMENNRIGLYDVADFRLSDGHCTDCNTIPQALWYFQDDLVATPKQQAEGFVPTLRAQADVQAWAGDVTTQNPLARPALLWMGSPQIATGTLSQDGSQLTDATNSNIPFSVVPKIPANQSYYDASSIAYFAHRPLLARGQMTPSGFVARTLWPDDFALEFSQLEYAPLVGKESLDTLVRQDGVQPSAPLSARILWQRNPTAARHWNGKPVLGIMLNGAQGDDDEAHGGHFAIATGAFGPQGQWGNWLVNNFYNLGSVSEKGIIASMLPMDAYMADLNSGQSWYRPSYMIVAVLNQSRAPLQIQAALARVYNHFYRQDFVYHHATANCTGISMETLRSLGWQIPTLGPTDAMKAVVALPFMTVKDQSLASGEQAFDYLMAEQTNLYPFVGFNAIGQDILQRISTGNVSAQGLEKMLAEDIEALIYVRIPQFPSSRAWGQAPIASLDEYMNRVPENRADWKIIPVPPREFPVALKDPAAAQEPPLPSQIAVYSYAGVFGIGLLGLVRYRSRRRKST